jgi:hypothetical protein
MLNASILNIFCKGPSHPESNFILNLPLREQCIGITGHRSTWPDCLGSVYSPYQKSGMPSVTNNLQSPVKMFIRHRIGRIDCGSLSNVQV